MPEEEKPFDEEMGMIPDTRLAEVSDRYRFCEDWRVLPFLNIDGYPVAITRRSETARKAVVKQDNDRVLVKEFPWYVNQKELVEFIATLQYELANTGVPVPDVLSSNSGHIYIQIENHFYYVQKFVSGDSTSVDHLHRKAGKTLAKLHNGGRNTEALSQFSGHRESVISGAQGIGDVLEGVVGENVERLESDELESINSFIAESQERLSALEDELSKFGDHRIPIHGDFNPTNLVTSDNEIKAVVDFDNACFGQPERDIAEGIVTFSQVSYKPHTAILREIDEEVQVDEIQNFIDGYISEAPPDQIQVEMIPPAIEAVLYELITLGVARGDLPFDHASPYLGRVASIREEVQDIVGIHFK